MSKARNLADLLDASGDVQASSLDSQPQLGRRNLIINGAMQVAQRGTTFSNAWNYGVDRWVHPVAATQSNSATEGYYTTFTGQASANSAFAFTTVELPKVGSNYPFTVGKTFTISFRVNSTSRVRPYFAFRNGVVGANSGFTSTAIDYKGGSGSWETVSWTVDVTATCGSSDNCVSISFGHEDANASVSITQVQLELGSVATPFEHRSYGEELALCQRYYETCGIGDAGNYEHQRIASNSAYSYTHPPVRYKVTKRVAPSVTIYGLNGTAGTVNLNGANSNYTAVYQNGTDQFSIYKSIPSGYLNYFFEFDWTADAEL